MIFAQYGYKEFNGENKDNHPLQPYHIDNWCKMVNENRRYCQKMNWFKWIEFYFLLSIGRFKMVDTPSFHRYWKTQTNKQDKKSLKDLTEKYELCKKDTDQIKYLFNANTSLIDLEKRIKEKKKKIF